MDYIPTGILHFSGDQLGRSHRTGNPGASAESATPISRAWPAPQITGRTVGMLKLLFSPVIPWKFLVFTALATRRRRSSISAKQLWPKGEANTIQYFVNTTFNYPTMAEAAAGGAQTFDRLA